MSLHTHRFLPGEVEIDLPDIYRLMNLDEREAPPFYSEIIEREVEQSRQMEGLCCGYRLVEPVGVDTRHHRMEAGGTRFGTGRFVSRKMRQATRAAFFVCTAGPAVSERIDALNQEGDVMGGYVADIVGTLLVERITEYVHKRIGEEAAAEGLKVTNRYSPGYCDWNVEEQHALFRLFPEGICGVRLKESGLMVPVKSVSGLIGIGRDVTYDPNRCAGCDRTDCIYRQERVS